MKAKKSNTKSVAPDPGICHARFAVAEEGPDFFRARNGAGKDATDQGWWEFSGDFLSRRDLPSMTDYRVRHYHWLKELVMGIIAWIVLGLAAGLVANMLIPGRRSQGLILTCLIGVAGALLGGWVATKLFHIHSLQGFFNLSTWVTAIVGAAVLLLAYHLLSGQSGRSRAVPAVPLVRAPLRMSGTQDA
jgi:uncharacterized membrane protein YeaQ/YmgE (transglycosylase-associated protein family)